MDKTPKKIGDVMYQVSGNEIYRLVIDKVILTSDGIHYNATNWGEFRTDEESVYEKLEDAIVPVRNQLVADNQGRLDRLQEKFDSLKGLEA